MGGLPYIYTCLYIFVRIGVYTRLGRGFKESLKGIEGAL